VGCGDDVRHVYKTATSAAWCRATLVTAGPFDGPCLRKQLGWACSGGVVGEASENCGGRAIEQHYAPATACRGGARIRAGVPI